MSKVATLSARETRRYMNRVIRYGEWCRSEDPTMSFEEACGMEVMHRYDNLQLVTDAYFLLTRPAFQASWRKGFNPGKNTESQLF